MHKRTLVAVLALTSVPVAVASAGYGSPKITKHGVGAIKLGSTYAQLKAKGLVKQPIVGCELAGPTKDAAQLKGPVKGVVSFTGANQTINNVVIFKGASVRGVGPGSTLAQIQAAFPNGKVIHTLEQTFRITEVKIKKADGGPFIFAVDQDTGKTTSVGIPFVPTCD